MNKYVKWSVFGVVLAAAIAAVAWYFVQHQQPVESVADETETEAESSVSASTPAAQHPLAGAEDAAPVTNVDDSDDSIKSSLEQLFGTADLAEVLIPTQIIRHIVVTVDNLPRDKLATKSKALRDTPGQFAVSGTEDNQVLADTNYARYARVMHIVRVADIAQVAAWYRRHYSLFEQTYRDLGYPQGYFNDRLVQTIDDLLATPEPATPIRLIQPKVFYEFADPDLESRSTGQKILLRMGPDNTKLIKQKLRELRTDITKPLK